MKKISVIIVDDEPLAARRIRRYLESDQQFEVLEEARDGIQAVEAIRKLKPELVFLDIQMPGMTGFDVIQKIGINDMPLVIFVTAYDQYTLQAFDVSAVDYLLKPFSQNRFQKSLDRARERLQIKEKNHLPDRLSKLLETLNQKQSYLDRLFIKTRDKIKLVETENIEWVDAMGNYLNIRVGDKFYLYRCTLSELEKQLDPSRFVRINRSCIVNINYIQIMEKFFNGKYIVVLKNGTKRKLNRKYYDRIFSRSI